jgi:hypothetical protein
MQVIEISAKCVFFGRCMKALHLENRPAVVIAEFPELLHLPVMFFQLNGSYLPF